MTTYTGTSGEDVLVSSNTSTSQSDTLNGMGVGGTGGTDVLVGGAGNDVLNDGISGSGINVDSAAMYGGLGNDTYYVNSNLDTINENPGEGTDLVITTVSFSLAPFDNVENITAKLGAGAINLTGNDGNNVLDGSQDTSANVLTGGLGNDTYIIGAGDTIVENSGEGNDTVEAAFTIDLNNAAYANVENATLLGTAAGNLTGVAGVSNILTGNSGTNIFNDGGAGAADTMIGNGGTDTYFVNNSADTVVGGAAVDFVSSSVDFNLATNGSGVEKLTLTGTALVGTGNSLSNIITGNNLGDTLDGGAGTDTLNGGTGNDTFMVDVTTDKIVDAGGTDTVIATLSTGTYTLASGLENLTLGGTAAINGTGNSAANVITGNSNNNILSDGGGAGVDTLIGGLGNDTYLVSNAADVVSENGGEGTDLIIFSGTTAGTTFSLITSGANVENLTLGGSAAINGTGNTSANVIIGNAAANVLNDGGVLVGGGADTLEGGAGNDTYVLHNTNDVIMNETGGTDTVDFVTSSNGQSYSLATGLENITLSGGFASSATGNAVNNILIGDGGANTLDGGLGSDVMKGGAGNDTYYCNVSTDIVVETATGGTADTVYFTSATAGSTYTLSSYVENLILTGSAAINGNGNAQDNIIEGNAGNNILNGSGGIDTISYANASGGVTVDLHLTTAQVTGGAGTDTLSNFENMLGSAFADTLTGSAGNNTIDGGGGNDTLTGGGGTDTVSFASSSVGVTVDLHNTGAQVTGNGTDTISGFTNIIGSAQNDTLSGDAGNNTIDGGGGNDTVSYANAAAGVVVDLATGTASGDGNDTLLNISNAIGSTNDDVLIAAATGSVLDGGGSGVNGDTLEGGLGNDIFIVHSANDVATSGGGTDTLESSLINLNLNSLNYSGIHNATLLGSSNLNIVGDTQGDVLTGNSGDNTITGGSGNDTLDGGGSVSGDSLIGGGGDDTFIVHASGDIADNTSGSANSVLESGQINLDLTSSNYTNLENATLLGTSNLNLTGDANANVLTGNSGNNVIDGGGGADSLIGGGGTDTYIIHTGTEIINDTGGVSSVVESSAISINLTNANLGGVENATLLTGASGLSLTGDANDNVLTDSSVGGNTLDGGGSVLGDQLFGSSNDTFIVHSLLDTASATGTGNTLESASINLDLTSANYSGIENATATGVLAQSLTGDANANVLIGSNAGDTFNGGGGLDTMTGGTGVDDYNITAAPNAGVNNATITNFDPTAGTGDVLDIHSILSGYVSGTSVISNFVEITASGSDAVVSVSANGTGAGWVQVATLSGQSVLAGDEATLVAQGNLFLG